MILVAVAFGLSFEFPVLLVFLEMVGVLSTRSLRKWRRYSILGIALFAAIITPSSDPYTMLALMIPMCLFYEAAIIIGRFMKKYGGLNPMAIKGKGKTKGRQPARAPRRAPVEVKPRSSSDDGSRSRLPSSWASS